jgi:hypothetical protein
MKNSLKSSLLGNAVIAVTAIGIIVLLLQYAYIGSTNLCLHNVEHFINHCETTGDHKCLAKINEIQQLLENTKKTNEKISFLAVYSDDGTILAHFRPERIGKNMFDVDDELSSCMQDMFSAIKNRQVFKWHNYDSLINDNIRFIEKPLQVSDSEHSLSLLMGVPEFSVLSEINTISIFIVIMIVIASLSSAAVIFTAFEFFINPIIMLRGT